MLGSPDASVGRELPVRVGLQKRRLRCPKCDFTTRHRCDTREADSNWRHLDDRRPIEWVRRPRVSIPKPVREPRRKARLTAWPR